MNDATVEREEEGGNRISRVISEIAVTGLFAGIRAPITTPFSGDSRISTLDYINQKISSHLYHLPYHHFPYYINHFFYRIRIIFTSPCYINYSFVLTSNYTNDLIPALMDVIESPL